MRSPVPSTGVCSRRKSWYTVWPCTLYVRGATRTRARGSGHGEPLKFTRVRHTVAPFGRGMLSQCRMVLYRDVYRSALPWFVPGWKGSKLIPLTSSTEIPSSTHL